MNTQPPSRVTRTKAEAAASYNRLSRWYDGIAGSTEKKYRDLGLRALDAQPGEHILEIGFGTGHAILALARAVGPTGKVCGIDISQGMWTIAEKRTRRAGVSGWVELRVEDAAQLPYPPGSLDAVFMSFTLELFDTPEIPQVLAECYRILRSGGRIALVVMVKPERAGFAVRMYEWAHARWPAMVDCRPIDAREALHAAGFQLDSAKRFLMWGLAVDVIRACKK